MTTTEHTIRSRDRWLWKYAREAANPLAWEFSAKRLKESANLIFDYFRPTLELAAVTDAEMEELVYKLNPLGAYYLLAALALENLLKGILVAKSPEKVTKLGWRGPGHNLSQLCRDAKIKLSAKQERLIERLTAYLKWAGRYPIFSNEKDLFPTDGTEGTPLTMGPIEKEAIDKMFADFEKCLLAHARKHRLKRDGVQVNSNTITRNGKVELHRGEH